MPETDGTRVRQARQMAALIEQYNKAHDRDANESTEPHLVAEWAVATGRWVRPPSDPEEILRRQLSRYLRNEHIRDPQGRLVRKYHAVVEQQDSPEGPKRRSRWYSIQDAPPKHMQVSLQVRRRAAFNDVYQLSLDFDSYNENNTRGATLPPMDFDFNRDLEEAKQPTEYPHEPPEDGFDDDGEEI